MKSGKRLGWTLVYVAAIFGSRTIDGVGAAHIATGTVGVIVVVAGIVLSVYVAAYGGASYLAKEMPAGLGLVSAVTTLGALVVAPDANIVLARAANGPS